MGQAARWEKIAREWNGKYYPAKGLGLEQKVVAARDGYLAVIGTTVRDGTGVAYVAIRFPRGGTWQSLPEALEVRIVRFRVTVPGFRTHEVIVVTTLLDEQAYPDEAIAALYRRRWAVELCFRDIKTTLGLDVLRCQSPELIEKEVWLQAIAYNLVRALMLEAAWTHDVSLERLSFKGTVDTLRQLLSLLNKEAIIVQDLPGFVSNRISHLFMNEAAFVLQDNVATAEQIDKIFRECFGHKMGPLETADLIGLDTVMRSLDVLYESFQDPKYRCCPLLRKLVHAGHLGRKTGRGFYVYPEQ